MNKNFDTDVLICGAGAAGLTLAIDLARRGVAFQVIERLGTPFPGSRGKGIQPRTQEIFEDLGILDKLSLLSGEYPPQREYHADGTSSDTVIIEKGAENPAEPYTSTILAAQFYTERAMRNRLDELGYQVAFGVELLNFTQCVDSVQALVRDTHGTHHIRARYLIGTDGGQSFIRTTLGIGFPGKTLGVRAVVADVRLRGLSRDAWHRFNSKSPERLLLLCPLLKTELFQLQAPLGPEEDIDLSEIALQAIVRDRTGRSDILVDSVNWASAFNMSARLADRYREGRVLIVGDAAHVHPPTGAQGLNTSVQDAYNLGWKLAAVLNGAPDILLETYEEERRPVAATMLGLSAKLLEAEKRGVSDRKREVQQLDLGYAEASLAAQACRMPQSILPGVRAPDAPLRDKCGLYTRLFDLFKGPHWTLLGYEVQEEATSALRPNVHMHTIGRQADLLDEAGHFKDGYGIDENEWILVRPDGYVGAVVPANQLIALNRYMDQVGA